MSRTGPTPFGLEQLDDYVSGAMGDAEADSFELSLFEAAAGDHGGELAFWDRLRRSIAELVQRGSFEITMTVAEAEALVRRPGLHARIFDPVDPNAPQELERVLPHLDLVLYSMPANLEGVTRVDLELGRDGKTALVLPDVRVDYDENRVVICCEGELARAVTGPGSFTRIVAVEGTQRRTLSEYLYPGTAP